MGPRRAVEAVIGRAGDDYRHLVRVETSPRNRANFYPHTSDESNEKKSKCKKRNGKKQNSGKFGDDELPFWIIGSEEEGEFWIRRVSFSRVIRDSLRSLRRKLPAAVVRAGPRAAGRC